MLQHSEMKNHTLSAKPKKKGTVYSRKDHVRTSNDSETLKEKLMAYVQTATRWYNTPTMQLGWAHEEQTQAGRLQTANICNYADENIVAERQEAEGDGANDKLGFGAVLLTVQHLAKTMPC